MNEKDKVINLLKSLDQTEHKKFFHQLFIMIKVHLKNINK